jgi:hypothetical protein
MPANLTPQYHSAEDRYKAASSIEDKLAALKEMIALLPKHKGTEKIHANLKKSLSKLNGQAQQAQAKKGSSNPHDHVDREGAGQIAMIGLPNSGKSTLLNLLTNAESEVAEYPFSTLKPTVGMAAYEDAQMQLIDLPPVSEEYTEGWVWNLIRNADRACIFLDLSAGDIEELWLDTLSLLEDSKLQVVGGPNATGYGPSTGILKSLIVGTKSDIADPSAVDQFENLTAEEFDAIVVNETEDLNSLRKHMFDLLDVIRIYSKEPGKPADQSQPFVLKRGSTTMDLAHAIHKDIASNLKYALVWGSAQFDGQRISHDYVLQDTDIVEVHA